MNKGLNLYVLVVALVAGFAGFIFGFDSSMIASLKEQIIQQLALSDWQWSQIVSASLLGCIIGIPVSGYFSNKISRKFLLKCTAIGYIIGALLCALSNSLFTLLIGRFLIGICVGIASYVAPLFIAEIAPPNRRGALILINGLTITFGQAMAYLAGYFLHDYNWQYLFITACIPAMMLLLGMLFVPHSPRWIMQKYGAEETWNVLKKIRPAGYDVSQELNEIQANSSPTQTNYRLLFQKPVIYVLLIGIALGIFQQGSGINAIMYYGPVIFESAGFLPVKNAILATFCIGVVNFIFTIFTSFYIDKLGRRVLLLSGTFIAAISLFSVSYFFAYPAEGQQLWILGFLSLYVMGYCISVGSLFWVLIAEIFPLSVRGLAMSIATLMQCGANFVISLSFLSVYNFMGQALTFSLFGFICFLAYQFIYFFIPETKGVSLEKIETNLISGEKMRNLGVST